MLDFLIILQVKVKLNVNVKFDGGILMDYVEISAGGASHSRQVNEIYE